MAVDDRNIDAEAIADYIVSKNILDKKSMNDALEAHLLKKLEAGFAYYNLDQYGKTIHLRDEKGVLKRTLELPISSENVKPLMFNDGRLLFIDEDNTNTKIFIERDKATAFSLGSKGGLIKYKDNVFSLPKWYGEISTKDSSLPLDVHFFEKLPNYIFFTDRKLGKIFIVNSNLQKIVKEIKITKKDQTKAINIVYSPKNKKCYITDYQSPEMFSINMENYALEKFNPGLGNLGNLVISKDERTLYILGSGLNKSAELLNVSLNNFKMVKKIILKGKLLSEQSDPLDLISISSSGKTIFVLTQLDKPILNIISTDTYEIISSANLNEKPVGFAIKANYNLPDLLPSFSQFLIEKKIMHESNMQNVINELKGTNKTKKEFKKDVLLDQDVADIQSKMESELKGNQKALNELIEPSEKDFNRLLSDTGVDWQGRKMSKEDKNSLINGLASIKANNEVSKTNGVFVLSWMNDLLEP